MCALRDSQEAKCCDFGNHNVLFACYFHKFCFTILIQVRHLDSTISTVAKQESESACDNKDEDDDEDGNNDDIEERGTYRIRKMLIETRGVGNSPLKTVG